MPLRLSSITVASLLSFTAAVNAGDSNNQAAASNSSDADQSSWRLQWDLGLNMTDTSVAWKQVSRTATDIINSKVEYADIKSQGFQTDIQFEVFDGFLANTLWQLSMTQDAIDDGISEVRSSGTTASSGKGNIDGDKLSDLSVGIGLSKRFTSSRMAMLIGYYSQEQNLTSTNNTTIDLPSALDITSAGPWLAFDVTERAGNHQFNWRAEYRGGDSDVDISAGSSSSYSVGGATGLMSLRYDYLFLQHWSVWLKGQVARQSVKTYKASASPANGNTSLQIQNMDVDSEQLALGFSLNF